MRSARRSLRRAAAVAIAAGALAVPLAAAGPASADEARTREQWVLAALHVPDAWRISQGRGVTVAVIDSGVDPSVSDLTGSVITGPDYSNVHTPPSNPNWGAHGTWMASLIAGHGHGPGHKNGIEGVAPLSKVLSIRVITDQSDPNHSRYMAQPASRGQAELARAIRYAVSKRAGVISMSLGYDAYSLRVRSAIQYALSRDVVVVASSGNSQQAGHAAAPYSFPADYPGVIGVGAVTQSGQAAYFSSENLSVQVAAPGVSVPAQGRGSKYWVVSGTSPACALTAGVAALIKSRYPHLSAAQVRAAITESTRNRPRAGYDYRVGFGTVDAAAALHEAGQLAKDVPGGDTAAGKAAASGTFGGDQSGGPPFPVAPRGRERLYMLLAIGGASLLLLVLALWRLIRGGRRRRTRLAAAGPAGPQGVAGAAADPGSGAAVHYPTQIFPAQPFRQGRPAPGSVQQVPGYPVAGYPGQPGQAPQDFTAGQYLPPGYPAQAVPAQPGTAEHGQGRLDQLMSGYGYPPQAAAGQTAPGVAHPGQVPPAAGYPGQAVPGPGVIPPGTAGHPGQAQPGGDYQPAGNWSQPGQAAPGQQGYPAGYPEPAGSAWPAPASLPVTGLPPAGSGPAAGYPGQAAGGPASVLPPQAYADPGAGYHAGGVAGQAYPGQAPSPGPAAAVPTPSGAVPPHHELPAPAPAGQADDEWWFDQEDGQAAVPPGATGTGPTGTVPPGMVPPGATGTVPPQSGPSGVAASGTVPPVPDQVQASDPLSPGWAGVPESAAGLRPRLRDRGGLGGLDATTPLASASERAIRMARLSQARSAATFTPAAELAAAEPVSAAGRAGATPAAPEPAAPPAVRAQPDAGAADAVAEAPPVAPGVQEPAAPAVPQAVAGAGSALTSEPTIAPGPARPAEPADTPAPGVGPAGLPKRTPGAQSGGEPGRPAAPSGPEDGGTSYRSVWEPLVRSTSTPASQPAAAGWPRMRDTSASAGQPAVWPRRAASPAEPPAATPSIWPTGQPEQPTTVRRPGGAGASAWPSAPAAPASAQGDTEPGPMSLPRYIRSTGISRQPAAGPGSAGALPRRENASPAQQPPAAGAQPAGQAVQPPAGRAQVPGSQPASGTQPLPRRQPQTHLAAPLRRSRSSALRAQPEPSRPLPSVWETRRSAVTADQAGPADGQDARDQPAG